MLVLYTWVKCFSLIIISLVLLVKLVIMRQLISKVIISY